jgi:DNA ligase (NAD+)
MDIPKIIPTSLISVEHDSSHRQVTHSQTDKNALIEIRGEVYVNLKEFHQINEARIMNNKSAFSTPRNLASGTLRQIYSDKNNDSEVKVNKKLNFFAYSMEEIVIEEDYTIKSLDKVKRSKNMTQERVLHVLKQLGFQVASPFLVLK